MADSAILSETIQVLDHGFVRYVEHMGNDAAIVQAARVSMGKGTKKAREDRGLIRYMLRNKHTSPFEMVEIKFHARMPIFVARQWIRHRTANVNELSGRYSQMPEDCYVPGASEVRKQSETNKQGRSDEGFSPDTIEDIQTQLLSEQVVAHDRYKERLEQGVARELSRINLPLSQYSEWYWKLDLHNLFHFFKLRLNPHAQWEIRQYAKAMYDITKAIVPVACEAFEDYVLAAVTFSAEEIRRIRVVLESMKESAGMFLPIAPNSTGFDRELEEFKTKLGLE